MRLRCLGKPGIGNAGADHAGILFCVLRAAVRTLVFAGTLLCALPQIFLRSFL
jgi:hypothetical protein